MRQPEEDFQRGFPSAFELEGTKCLEIPTTTFGRNFKISPYVFDFEEGATDGLLASKINRGAQKRILFAAVNSLISVYVLDERGQRKECCIDFACCH